jgi:transmembrane sensor
VQILQAIGVLPQSPCPEGMTNERSEVNLDRLPEDDRWEVLARYIAGESAADEAEAVRVWLAADPAQSLLLRSLTHAMDRIAFEPPAGLDVEQALAVVAARLGEAEVVPLRPSAASRRPAWMANALRAAAAVALVVAGGLVVRSMQSRRVTAPVVTALTYQTPVGRADTVNLADGSRVVLGPDSRLALSATFGATDRGVELDGQALFTVKHDATLPFRVRSGQATIEDLGTTFSVRNQEGGEVRVVVTEGSVKLAAVNGAAGSGLVLGAGDLGVLSADGTTRETRGGASDDDVAWTRGRLIFRDATLAEVRTELRRWYGLDLRVEDASLEQRHLTATFEGESAGEVLEVIGLSIGANIEQQGNVAVVRAQSGSR